jgi:gas vesicle protein
VRSADEIKRMSERLREIAERLRDDELPDATSDELAREAADLVAKAGAEIDRAVTEIDEE